MCWFDVIVSSKPTYFVKDDFVLFCLSIDCLCWIIIIIIVIINYDDKAISREWENEK